MNILITGGTGYIGRNLIAKLTKKNDQLILLVRDKSSAEKLFREYENVIIITTEDPDLRKKIEQLNVEMVIHLAAYSTSGDDLVNAKKLISCNLEFGTILLDLIKSSPVKSFIYTGTFAEYQFNDGKLESAYLYAATKTAFRSILDYYRRKKGFRLFNVVPYSVYGENDTRKKVIHFILDSLNNPKTVAMTSGEQTLDFIYIEDVISFFSTLISKIDLLKEGSYEFHLGSGRGYQIREVAEMLEKLTNKKANVKWGAIPYRENDMMHAVAPIGKNIELLGWKPQFKLMDGLQKLIAHDDL